MRKADGGGVQMTVTDAVSAHFAAAVPSETVSPIVKVPAAVHVNVAPVVDRFVNEPEVADHVAASAEGPLSGSCATDVSWTEPPT